MVFNGQKILPAIKSMKDFEKIVGGEHTFIVILDMHLSKLASLKKLAREAGKKLIIHADLIQGLKSDRAAAEFLCQVIKPAGLISTRAEVLRVAKKNNVLAIQRVFLLDTLAIETSFQQANTIKPDIIEMLPGILPQWIERVQKETGIDVVAGGLIESEEDVQRAIQAGASAVTSSNQHLWQ